MFVARVHADMRLQDTLLVKNQFEDRSEYLGYCESCARKLM